MPTFEFASSSAPGVSYRVSVSDDGTRLSCNCPGWTRRVAPDGSRTCKHLTMVRQQQLLATPTTPRRAAARVAAAPAKTMPTVAGRPATGDVNGYVQPMLASPFAAGESLTTYIGNDEWWLEEKFDGHRVIVYCTGPGRGVRAWSRPRDGSVGLPRQLPAHVVNVLDVFPTGTYDGELIVPGGHAWNVTEGIHAQSLRLVLFDILMLDGVDLTRHPAAQRRRRLEAIADVLHRQRIASVFVAPAYPVSASQVATIWKAGGEGAILKRRTGIYHPGKRSQDWIKVKRCEQLVCTITGFRAGKSGPFSTVELRLPDGGVTTVKTKDAHWLREFTKNHKQYVGRLLRIEHQGLHDGVPRHPMFDHLLVEGTTPAPRVAKRGENMAARLGREMEHGSTGADHPRLGKRRAR